MDKSLSWSHKHAPPGPDYMGRAFARVTHGADKPPLATRPLVPYRRATSYDRGERAHPRVTAWFEEMLQTYDDLVDLVRICARNAYLTNSNDVAAALWEMAVEYRDKAAKLDSSRVPDIGEPPPRLRRSAVLTATARA